MSKSIAELFIEEAMRTNTGDYSAVIERISNPKTIKLAHAIIGMATEAGELLDALKKHIIYGKPLDEVNIIEECGDSNWYQALLLHTIGKTFEECMVANIQKLRKRYSDRFTEDEALNRNLEVERATLEEEFEGTITTNKILYELTEKENLMKNNDAICKNLYCSLQNKLPAVHTLKDHEDYYNNDVSHELTENVVDKVKMEIVDEPVIHWLSDVDKLTVLCTDDRPKEGEKYTLEENLVTCSKCICDLASYTT